MILSRKSNGFLAIFLTIIIALVFVFALGDRATSQERPTLYYGSTGESVKLVQNKLKSWGYYKGAIDGAYGAGTFAAVKDFQKKNGLTADGIVGDSTWNALGFATTPKKDAYSPTQGISRNDEINLLARLIHAEAEAEPYIGKVAVGAVMLNRVNDPKFPKSISANIFKPGEFESVSNGRINNITPTDEDVRAAQDAFNGYDPSYGSLFFWNPSKPVSKWIWSRQIIVRYGNHVFGK